MVERGGGGVNVWEWSEAESSLQHRRIDQFHLSSFSFLINRSG